MDGHNPHNPLTAHHFRSSRHLFFETPGECAQRVTQRELWSCGGYHGNSPRISSDTTAIIALENE